MTNGGWSDQIHLPGENLNSRSEIFKERMMLTLFTDGRPSDCDGLTRRNFIQAGALGLGGLTLPGLLAAKASAGQQGKAFHDKSVVVLFLSGGATHIETFDPKMTAPAEFRSMTGEAKTCLPGVSFGGGFPQLAKHADKMAVVRSFKHGSSSHGRARQMVLGGGNPMQASMGSLYAASAGTSNPRTGVPNYINVSPRAIDRKKYNVGDAIGTAGKPGNLGSVYAAFDPSSGGAVLENMKLNVPNDRLGDRRSLLYQLDRLKRDRDASQGVHSANKFQQQAFDVILGDAADAFDLSKENPKLVQRYSTDKFKDKNGAALGKQMLMARRLCEAGAGFVTVSSGGWDMHKDLVKSMDQRGNAVDNAVAAFLEDVHDRGLSDKILLVVTGEFGRTPKINKKAGRDHWGNLCTLALAGGGLPMGQVIGESNPTASVPASPPIGVGQLMATVMHTLIDPGQLRLMPTISGEVSSFLGEHSPIEQLT
ncbi:MAG: DUF1501 domain-containing protein [Planctomycetales bacterium]